ncbi:MazG family protein [Yinghuangia sp. ASG 101]|uniref:MazG family protein n=1 Tax=Yinghuangia sp. ASG 101 TaxID=2896848 RepID=UPI001E500DAF|nr:MazG family protein [Yinghuangia sp. ASG 101]UGQ14487.1 MazG family protein [Yinghuangia sp. ASG 101]
MSDETHETHEPPQGPPRLILLTGTHRVAPGLLSWPAWQVLRATSAAGGRVLTGEADHPQLPYVREAGVDVTVVAAGPAPALARRLMADARTAPVLWLAGSDGDPELGAALAQAAAGAGAPGDLPAIEVVPGSWDLPGARVLDLVAVMDRLRSPGGCPWDARQSHASLVRYLVEEAYELVDAIDSGDRAHLREELGDVLLQVVFHARVAEEDADDPFTIDDVAGGIVAKLMHRHPHVFGDVVAETAEHVERNWEELKAAEKTERESVVDGIPLGQPALSLAGKVLSRTRRAGLDVPVPAVIAEPERVDADTVGALLLAVTELAGRHDVDAETALRAAALRHREAVRAAETAART